VDKKLTATNVKALDKFNHIIKEYYQEYKETTKLLSTYGERFITGDPAKKKIGYLEPDGKVRTTFNPIVSTGRLSSRGPNMQNIPANDRVGMRYRNAFTCADDEEYVDGDYASQELVIIAEISGDPVWNAALRKGEDLHSVCSELLYGKRWKDAADPDCQYYKNKQKCNCKKHKTLRNGVKSINFGLAYGMSKFKLAMQLKITVPEADDLMKLYFRTFPKIADKLKQLGHFGVQRGYIQTVSPFFRKRWFPFWRFARHYIDAHIAEVQYDPKLGSIERQSKNQPIQGTAADITKVSLVMLYWYIYDDAKIEDKVKLVMQVHDQDTTIAKKHFSAEWKPKLQEIMEEAGRFIIKSGLLKAEVNCTPRWSK
jgi:DNA polymerase-1